MSMGFGKTTKTGSGTTSVEAGAQRLLALAIAWSEAQPHRVGEIAFLPLGKWVFIGRGDPDTEIEKFAQFVRQRPGQIAAVDPREGVLDGPTLSRRQLNVRFMGDFVEVENIGRCRMYINGKECQKGILRHGDTLRLEGEVVLVCVWRSRALPARSSAEPLHAYGEADAYGIVGESEAAHRMRAQLESAAQGDEHVLIEGESGTGKELAAKVMQRRSSRARGPWVSRNAAIFTTTLIASELFGNPAGYPNPESEARPGLMGAADRGTIFFDEIGDCPRDVQAQLLRVMETGEYQRQGEVALRRVDVRFIGATNKDDSAFRPDFHARFSKRVRLPPLRERREDIGLLIRHLLALRAQKDAAFKKRFCREGIGGRIEPRLSGRLVDELVRHPLPTNVRQLKTLLNEAIEASEGGDGDKVRLPSGGFTTSEGTVAAQHGARGAKGAQGDAAAAGEPGRETLVAWLKQEGGNVTRVAQRAGVQRRALYRLMERYGIKGGSR
jgi:two-component system nitrogen regulation response regulator GlnG/two-component system response regulator HydG